MLLRAAAFSWWVLLGSVQVGSSAASTQEQLQPALLCFEETTLAAHKGIGVALRRLAGRMRVSDDCGRHGAAGSDAMARSSELLIIGVDSSLPPQSYEFHGDKLRLTGGDVNGVIYGLLELPKLLRKLRQSALSLTASAAHVVQRGAPAYSSRVYSIEGQYLDLPDVAYLRTPLNDSTEDLSILY